MILLNETPPGAGHDLVALYQRMSCEGMIQSTLMHGERYETSDAFNEDWAYPAITWSAGGEENYRLEDGKTFSVNSAGALILGADTRYNYAAGRDTPFYSNMIAFPRWMARAASRGMLDEDTENFQTLSTRMLRPDASMEALMNVIAAKCRAGFRDENWFIEQASLLYGMLLEAQHNNDAAHRRVSAAKPATRKELARRIHRAQEFMLQTYGDADLGLKKIASAACLSPFHLIRVFKKLTALTPMQYLTAVRMEGALRLLRETKATVSDVAALVGFSDRSAFSRAFRKHHGFAPSVAQRN